MYFQIDHRLNHNILNEPSHFWILFGAFSSSIHFLSSNLCRSGEWGDHVTLQAASDKVRNAVLNQVFVGCYQLLTS
jgi:hypothetical protein